MEYMIVKYKSGKKVQKWVTVQNNFRRFDLNLSHNKNNEFILEKKVLINY